MALLLCRFIVFNSSFCRHQLQVLAHPNLSSPNYPINSIKLRPKQVLDLSRASNSSSSMEAAPEGYRRNVGICLINPSKKIFTASRLDIPDSWQMPQGGIDENEDPRDAVIRELREETGVTSAEVIAEVPYWLTYDFPPDVREKLKHQWGSDWKGQAQKWFLLIFNGKEEEINLLGDGTEKPEFGEWSWMSPEQVVDHAVDFKKPVYKEVLTAFFPRLQ
ncbi:nudix hydrolase 26, chloroplastic [Actinidia eriantha]|uniref:nudix hydrolase 26, chloroplastic n=1 Tax=Actinidia eriantha TaxID=165200 RepID=UPI00258C9E22|nr:nudix hydrolase 26, chloroplastic [Actinidia eriantha]